MAAPHSTILASSIASDAKTLTMGRRKGRSSTQLTSAFLSIGQTEKNERCLFGFLVSNCLSFDFNFSLERECYCPLRIKESANIESLPAKYIAVTEKCKESSSNRALLQQEALINSYLGKGS